MTEIRPATLHKGLTTLKEDRFLVGILSVIAILILAALALFFLRRGSQAYLAENSPQAVVHNYVLALQKGDYQRAYSYLSDNTGKPSFARFQQALISNQSSTSTAAIQMGEVTITGDQATVSLTVLQSGSGPFADTFRSTQVATVLLQAGAWKIDTMPYPYWSYDWYQPVPPIKAAPAG